MEMTNLNTFGVSNVLGLTRGRILPEECQRERCSRLEGVYKEIVIVLDHGYFRRGWGI